MDSTSLPPEDASFAESVLFNKLKKQLLASISKAIKKMGRKIDRLNHQLERCLNWPSIQHKGELIKANLPLIEAKASSILVWDWELDAERLLDLNPEQNAKEQMSACFKHAKKYSGGIEPLTIQLEKSRNELERLKKTRQSILDEEDMHRLLSMKDPILPKQTTQKASQAIRSPCYIEFISEKGLKIWVGRNAKANDQLTFRFANGRDWWLHASGCPGSHVVIRLGKEEEPDGETLKDAMQLALHYSKARGQAEGEILYTQKKYLSRSGRKRAGQVQVSKHKSAFVRFDPIRFRKLRERGLSFEE